MTSLFIVMNRKFRKMRHLWSILILAAITLSGVSISRAQDNSEGYDIQFHVKGAKDTIQLAYYYADKKLLKDKVAADEKGRFSFTGQKPLKRGIYMVIIPERGYFEFIAGDDQSFSMETDTSDLVMNMKIKGSRENELFYEYLHYIQPLGREADKVNKKYQKECIAEEGETVKDEEQCEEWKEEIIAANKNISDFKDNFIKEHPDAFAAKLFNAMKEVEVPPFEDIENDSIRRKKRYEHYKNHFFDNIDFSDEGMLRTPIFDNKLNKYLDEVLLQAPDTLIKHIDKIIARAGDNDEMFKYLVVNITSKYEKSNIMCIDKIPLHMFQKYYLNDERVDWIDSTTEHKIKVQVQKLRYNQCGDVAQEISMKDTTGQKHNLGSIDADYTVLYFWSATCGHCKKATPKLHDFYLEHKDDYNMEVFAVCIDKKPKEYKKFMNKHQLSWINVADFDDEDQYYRVKYNVYSTPVIYLLDKDKKIVAKRFDVETLKKILERQIEKEEK